MSHIENNVSPRREKFRVPSKSYGISAGVKFYPRFSPRDEIPSILEHMSII